VDFPGVHRVDHNNHSDISRVLHWVASHYEEELRNGSGNHQFLRYIASMWPQQRQDDDEEESKVDITVGEKLRCFVLFVTNLCNFE